MDDQAGRGEQFAVGYFGLAGGYGGVVHAVHRASRRPVCNVHLSPDAAFQWCADGIQHRMLECVRCREWNRRRMSAERSERSGPRRLQVVRR